MAMALQDHDETQQIIPAPTLPEPSEGCLARCSLTLTGFEQMETTFGMNESPGFCFSVAGEFQRDTISKDSEDMEYPALAQLKEKSHSSKNHAFHHILLSMDTMYTWLRF